MSGTFLRRWKRIVTVDDHLYVFIAIHWTRIYTVVLCEIYSNILYV